MSEKDAIEKMYDEAAEEYRTQCLMLQIPSLTNAGKYGARYNARIWKERMLWLDTKLSKLGEK